MKMAITQSSFAALVRRGMARCAGKKKAFWRGCPCGAEFFGVGRTRKRARRAAERHIQRCREKFAARMAERS